MTHPERHRVVLDCTVFARALINPNGPAGACVSHAQRGSYTLIISQYVLQEIRELPSKIKASRGVTADRVEALIREVSISAESWADVPTIFTHAVDPDDSHYVNLAYASRASHILSNDKHLLSLCDPATATGQAFTQQFPRLTIAAPEDYLRVLEPRTALTDQPVKSAPQVEPESRNEG